MIRIGMKNGKRMAVVVCPTCQSKPRGVPSAKGGWVTCPTCRGKRPYPGVPR